MVTLVIHLVDAVSVAGSEGISSNFSRCSGQIVAKPARLRDK